MLAQRHDRSLRDPSFSRRDLARLLVASGLLILALTAIFAIDIVPSRVAVSAGDIATTDILAPRAITYTSALRTQAAQDAARAAVSYQYDFTPDKAAAAARQQAAAFNLLVAPVDTAFDPGTSEKDRLAVLETALPGLTDESRANLLALPLARWPTIRSQAAAILDQLESTELRDTQIAILRDRLPGMILGGLNDAERKLAAEIVAPLLVPNSTFSQTLTDVAKAKAAEQVTPVTVTLSQGQSIVRKGDRVTADMVEQIDAFGLGTASWDFAKLAGWALFSTLLVGLLLAWVWRFRPELWHRTNVLTLVGLMLLFATFALEVTAGRSALPYIVPTAAVGILATLLLDAGTAMVLTTIIAIIAGTVNGGQIEMTAYVFFGGAAGIVAIRRGDRLNAFIGAGIAVAVVDALVVATFGLLGQRDLTGVLQLWGASAAAGGGAAVVAVGTFAVLGNMFGILTAFQLLELANPSQPLLRRLLIETPGTYHHSIMVANLAERAAEAIGADPLLTRVAAYYHDVGKLANPLAFIENQAGGDNVHDELDPETSAQILKAHVADGIDIAYRARLPKPLIAFIPQHHGTALISYFYAKAREIAAEPYGGLSTSEGEKAADAIDIGRYRHAGPKPQSREAALIMLADGVEASVRSLSSRDEPAIRAMVTRIIDERLNDGQFDECDLTLRDVEEIREAFVSQLLGMYHQRIAYPQSKVVELESRRAAAAGGGSSRGRSYGGGAGGGAGGDGGRADGGGRPADGGGVAGPGGLSGPDAG
jgi:putative nucleotidyltransferase with HDIG domain